MAYLADTNILLRWIEPGTVMCEQARAAVKILRASGEVIFITPQNVVEFWNGATRMVPRDPAVPTGWASRPLKPTPR